MITRSAWVLGIAPVLLAGAAAAQPVQPYRDWILGFRFVPPPGWRVLESQDKLGEVSLLEPASKTLLLISVAPAPGQKDDGRPATPAQLAQLGRVYQRRLAQSRLGSTYKQFGLLAAQPGRVGNFNTATLLFKGVPVVPSTPEGRVLVSVGGDRDRLVTLVVVGPSTFYPRVQPAAAAVARSFQLD
ncbi:hypothetical protein [Gloeobacter morelensis]|uniref:PsbP C-terminal domain-containing protein n=1 Tax=Gloeobacter morelensis MG652769 TaxID=2781736 RepID=A0ABY3PR29_9CYAN|nr:hypothetical protein [Gloeobacter morelensis]UFP96099.1 hypothetical protein ISF26_07780 [Gloeobacter morelensis MG652769]